MCALAARSKAKRHADRGSRWNCHSLQSHRYGPARIDVCAWRLQRRTGELAHARHLRQSFSWLSTCRRNIAALCSTGVKCGQSDGRLERVTWAHYAAQGKALLDHLGIERAYIMCGCMGVTCAIAFGVAYPQRVLSLLLYWSIGGARHRIISHRRFAEHLAFVQQHGLDAVVALVTQEGKPFGADPPGGPGPRRSSTTAPLQRILLPRMSIFTSSSSSARDALCSIATQRRAPKRGI